LPWFPLWNATFVLVFGSATLYYADPHWLILKDTLYDGLFGLVILIGLAFRKNLLKTFFVPLFAISDRGWHVLAVRWALFFLISAILNDVVRNLFSPAFWVHYKIAHAAASVAFGLLQLRLTGHERFRDEANRLGMRLTHKKDEPR
jgi:intracellular septation protein